MLASRKEKIRFVLTCIFSTFFVLLSIFTVPALIEFVIFEITVPSDGISAFFLFLFGTLFYITVPLFGMGILSAGMLAAFFSHSLRLHENPKIGKVAKICYVSDVCFIALDVVAITAVLLLL